MPEAAGSNGSSMAGDCPAAVASLSTRRSGGRSQPRRHAHAHVRARRNLSRDPKLFELAVHAVCRVMAPRVACFQARALALTALGLGHMHIR